MFVYVKKKLEFQNVHLQRKTTKTHGQDSSGSSRVGAAAPPTHMIDTPLPSALFL